jgi:hypothetical protein
MQEGWGYRIVLALSGITLILVVVYLILVEQNRSVQAEVSRRQEFINQSVQFSRVNEALVHALAAAAVNNKDDKLRGLLTQAGITINQKTGAPVPAAVPSQSAPAGTAPATLPAEPRP